MHVLNPEELDKRRVLRAKKGRTIRLMRRCLFFLLVVALIYGVAVAMVPVPPLRAEAAPLKLTKAQTVNLAWPAYGQAAIGAVGYGLLAQHGEQKPMPIASVAKVITALAVLKAHPISKGQQGEQITITAQDVAIYNQYVAEYQSVIEVEAGEQLTEYQALQALLLPSANNMADILVRWAFGSTDEYLTFANPFAKTLGMQSTTVADASGFSPKTVSTAVDLAKLAEVAMNQPVIAEIVGQSQADLPVAGTVYNVNRLVGQMGIVGIKTGNTDEAGGCFLFSAKRNIDNEHSVTVVGIIMGAPELAKALEASLPLLETVYKNFHVSRPLQPGQVVGSLVSPSGSEVPIIVPQAKPVVSWAGQTMRTAFKANTLTTRIDKGDRVGNLILSVDNASYEVPVVAGGTIGKPTLAWRLKHFAGYL